jgi:hypothetical protein
MKHSSGSIDVAGSEIATGEYKLKLDKKLAEKAEAYARKLKENGSLDASDAADRVWAEDKDKYCGESRLKLDSSISP